MIGKVPKSRDEAFQNPICKMKNCVCNRSDRCIVVSKCYIDHNGRCTGYTPRDK